MTQFSLPSHEPQNEEGIADSAPTFKVLGPFPALPLDVGNFGKKRSGKTKRSSTPKRSWPCTRPSIPP